jgi:fatty-acyl-CoA synthase
MTRPDSSVIPGIVSEWAKRSPDRPAVVSRYGTLSYAELDAAGAHAGDALCALGTSRGAPVGLLCTNRPEWLTTFLGAARLGASVAAFDTWSRPWDLEFLIANSEIEILITLDCFRNHHYLDDLAELVPELADAGPGEWASKRFPHLREVVVIGEPSLPGMRRYDDEVNQVPDVGSANCDGGKPGDVGLILYTSGSSARPKGVPLIQANMIENGFNIGERVGIAESDRVWLSVPLFWSYGIANATMATLTHGATLILQEVFEAGEALELIETERCTVAYTLPNITAKLLDHVAFARHRTATLSKGVTIGAPEDVRRAAEDLGIAGICNVYGSTETYGNCCVTPSNMPLEQRMECQGPPLPGMQIRIVEPDGDTEVLRGEVGEVMVGGIVAASYVGNAELSAATFASDGSYRTGDLGRIDGNGCFRFIARRSDMIKSGGINISPLEIETFLLREPTVRAVAVIGSPDPTLGEVAVAFVELMRGSTITGQELLDYCKQKLAGYKVPAQIVVCEGLPKTDTGKLDRQALRENALDTDALRAQGTSGRR